MDKKEFINKFRKDYLLSINNKKKKCVFPGCSCVSIKSHTISKENALRSIAKDGKVFTFKPCLEKDIHILKPNCVGIGEASIFRGFCQKHDALFSVIDEGSFNTKYSLVIQLFRSLGKIKTEEIENAKLIDEHRKTIIDYANGVFEKLGISLMKNYDKSYDKNYDSGLAQLDEMYNDLAAAIEEEKHQMEKEEITDRNIIKLGKWTILYSHLDYQIPLALSSKNAYKFGGDIFNIIWIVVPQENMTDIMIMLDADGINKHIEPDIVERNWEQRTRYNLAILETVEAAMATTENWYLNRDVYEALSEEKKRNLQFDVRYKCMKSFVWETINYTIFEDLWKKLLAEEKDPKVFKAASEKMAVIPDIPSDEEWKCAEKELTNEIFDIYNPLSKRVE